METHNTAYLWNKKKSTHRKSNTNQPSTVAAATPQNNNSSAMVFFNEEKKRTKNWLNRSCYAGFTYTLAGHMYHGTFSFVVVIATMAICRCFCLHGIFSLTEPFFSCVFFFFVNSRFHARTQRRLHTNTHTCEMMCAVRVQYIHSSRYIIRLYLCIHYINTMCTG